MKKTKKLVSFLLAAVMVLSMPVSAFAQTVQGDSLDDAKITISNAAKGERYSVYKLFDASVTGEEDGSIAYTGTIPEELEDYFEQDTAGNIFAKDAAKTATGEMSDGLKAALGEWVKHTDYTLSDDSDGSILEFIGIDYGYYVIMLLQLHRVLV